MAENRALVLHEDAFYAYFEPYRHPDAAHSSWGGLGLEPRSADMSVIRSIGWDHIWTVLDDGGRDQWIGTGIRFVNRICYLVTRLPHHDLPVEFRVSRRGRGLTARGLSQQLTRLRHHRER